MDRLPGSGRPRPPTMTMRQRLKVELGPLHERLDARITAACLSPRADAQRLLTVHASAFPPVVAGLEAAGAARLWPGWDGPARLAALSAELGPGALRGGGPSPPERFEGEAMVWGGLYALLGSRLGNKVILRRLAEAGEPTNSAFLRPGADDGPEWRRFLDRLEAATLGPAAGGAAEGAALVMERYLDAVERLGDRRAARIGEPLH
jgi:heme oxygenase